MIPNQCNKINEQCTRHNNGLKLKGQIHGAIYYHYFKQNIHTQDNCHSKLQLIRGFAVKGGGKNNNDCKIEVKSGAFSWIDLNFKDKRYRKLSPTQEKFLSFCLNQYWKQNNKTSFCFDEFLRQHQTPICRASKQAFVKTDAIKPA